MPTKSRNIAKIKREQAMRQRDARPIQYNTPNHAPHYMTYAELQKELGKLSPEQLAMDVVCELSEDFCDNLAKDPDPDGPAHEWAKLYVSGPRNPKVKAGVPLLRVDPPPPFAKRRQAAGRFSYPSVGMDDNAVLERTPIRLS